MTTKTRPTLKSPCVADRHHGPNERIAEFSFPNGKGGLISLRQHPELCVVDVYRCDEGIEVRTGNPKDWVDATRTPIPTPAPREYWAAYAGSAMGTEISLHTTERAALDAVVAGLGLTDHETDEGRAVCDMDEEEVREFLDSYCSSRADDWNVQEVTAP